MAQGLSRRRGSQNGVEWGLLWAEAPWFSKYVAHGSKLLQEPEYMVVSAVALGGEAMHLLCYPGDNPSRSPCSASSPLGPFFGQGVSRASLKPHSDKLIETGSRAPFPCHS